MTIKDLIDALQAFPQDAEGVGTWDSGWADIDSIFFEKGIVYLDVSRYEAFPHPNETAQSGEK